MTPLVPKPSLHIFKTAGFMTSAGEGALIGILLGAIARRIPMISALRVTNPAAYDAALGASVVSLQSHLANENKEPDRPQLLPGQSLHSVSLTPPDWTLM